MSDSIWIGAFLFFMCFFSACQQKNRPSHSSGFAKGFPSTIFIQTLQVFNLSEDMSNVSTKSDEVVLNVFLLEQKKDTLVLRDYFYSPSLSFDYKGQSHAIIDSLSVGTDKENELITVFTLTELDENDSVTKVQKTLRKELLTGDFLKRIDAIHLDTILGFDDFLGMHYFRLNEMEKGKAFELEFKGRQLFDKFEYHLIGTTF